MNGIHSTAQSGIGAASLRMASAAHNIANLSTEGAHRQVVSQQALPQGGVQATAGRAATPGSDPIADTVAQMQAGHEIAAGVAVLRRADDALGSLLDVRA